MIASLPRWFLLGLVLIAAGAVFSFIAAKRAELPEDCQTANDALGAGDHDLAIEHYILCIDSDDLDSGLLAVANYGLANAYFAGGNHHQAIQAYGETIAIEPRHAWAYNNRCWSYAILRRAEEALQDCDEALRLLPDQPEILDSRALAYWLLDQHDKARADLERAHQLDSSLPTSAARLREFEEMF